MIRRLACTYITRGLTASIISIYCSVIITACSFQMSSKNLAPDFGIELFGNSTNEKGQIVRLSDFEGQPIVLNFWYPSCAPCRLEMPHFEKAVKNPNNHRVKFLAVQVPSFDSPEEGQAFVDELGLTFSTGFVTEPQVIAKYKLIGWPSTVFINDKREIVRTWGGALNVEKLDILIQELLE